MKIHDFGVEIWMNKYETQCELNLAETCVESLTVAQLLEMAGKANVILEELLPLETGVRVEFVLGLGNGDRVAKNSATV